MCFLNTHFVVFQKNTNVNYEPIIDFDGANGVGSIAMQEFKSRLGKSLTVNIYNDDITTKGKLNNMVMI